MWRRVNNCAAQQLHGPLADSHIGYAINAMIYHINRSCPNENFADMCHTECTL